ncbi:hypothetical protein [Shewanella algae]|uniref:hypothetical protein n=1 Tax=Shewanella algae TaxID=38313 RepID=UPI0031F4AB1F
MAHLPWVMAPSFWLKCDGLKYNYSSMREVSTDIAALKVFIYMCIKSERKRKETPSSHHLFGLKSVIDTLEINVTYDEISDACNLSRTLIARGIKKLSQTMNIHRSGGTRKVIYTIDDLCHGWFKLPCKPLLGIDDRVLAFSNITNRKIIERDALKMYIYLLSVRSNYLESVCVSNKKIAERTGIKTKDIDEIELYLLQLELLEKISHSGIIRNAVRPISVDDHMKDYTVKGAFYLNKTTYYKRSVDYSGPSGLL